MDAVSFPRKKIFAGELRQLQQQQSQELMEKTSFFHAHYS
jgi:hypothetical protein